MLSVDELVQDLYGERREQKDDVTGYIDMWTIILSNQITVLGRRLSAPAVPSPESNS